MGLLEQFLEIGHGPVFRRDGVVIGNVVPVVRERAGIEGRDPDGLETEILDIVQFLDDAAQVADTVLVRVPEGTRINLVYRSLVPPRCSHVGILHRGAWP